MSFDPGEFWAAAADRRLLLRHCPACTRHHHYPREVCPFCHSDATEWVAAAGTGTIYSLVAIGRGPGAGTIPAFVTLAEGVTIQSAIVSAGSTPAVDMAVRVVFEPDPAGRMTPLFEPMPPSGAP